MTFTQWTRVWYFVFPDLQEMKKIGIQWDSKNGNHIGKHYYYENTCEKAHYKIYKAACVTMVTQF